MSTTSTTTASSKPETRNRAAIDERYTWDLSPIYGGWDEWEAGLARLRRLMDDYQQYKGTLTEGPQRVLAASRLGDELGQLAYRVYRYPGLQQSQDTRVNSVQARLEQVRIAFAQFAQATAWYNPELLTIPRETMARWLDETPGLAPYRFPIEETYRRAEHVLDEDGERLLAYASRFGGTPSETYSMLADADVKFPGVELSDGRTVTASHGNYMNGLRSQRLQTDRERLFRAHYTVYDGTPNTWASIYNGVLQRDWFTAQARHYETTLEAKLDTDGIPPTVVETLIETAMAGVEPLQRYHRLRRTALGLERYRYFDAYLPIVEADWPIYYDEVRALVVGSVEVFGEDYRRTVERAFDERWIDVYENEGKRSGAFSAGVYGVHPYMLLNYADTLEDAFTVAHEMGHTMHTELANRRQPFATSEYTIFVAEVASMTNEDLLREDLLGRIDDPLKRIVLLQHAVDDICSGFYRQTMFARFELEAHRLVERGEPITAERLQQLYLETFRAFFGDSLDDQDWERNTWARIPHFFNSPYYVFQYATAKAAASLLHERITTGPEEARRAAVTGYLELLEAGGSDNPVTLMATAGVDFTTSEPVETLVATMDRLVDELEQEIARCQA